MQKIISVAGLFLIWLIGHFVISRFFQFLNKKNYGIHISFIGSIVKFVWMVIIISMMGNQFEQTKEFSKTILTSSSLLVAVAGFAAQQVLADIISGIILSWSKPFDVGEKITITDLGISGIIERMSIRHTVIRTYQNSRLIVPNSVINKSVIENSNYDNHYIGNFIQIPISYESDLDLAIEIMEDVIANHELVIDTREDKSVGQKVVVRVSDLSEMGVILKCAVYTKDIGENFAACSDIRREIKRKFDDAGIQIHFKRMKVVS